MRTSTDVTWIEVWVALAGVVVAVVAILATLPARAVNGRQTAPVIAAARAELENPAWQQRPAV
jgi:hypothetical protein